MSVGYCIRYWIQGLICLALLLTGSSIYAEQPERFAFGLGLTLSDSEIEQLKSYDLVVIDGTDSSAAVIQELRSSGVTVLGYVSAGTIERGRPWSKRFIKQFGLTFWEEWGEWFAAVSKRRFTRGFIRRIARPVVRKNVDGLFLDNVDMISERPKQTRGMLRLLKRTRRLLGNDRLLFIQNGDEIIPTIERAVSFDGWNREDVTGTYDFDTETYGRVPTDEHDAALSFIQRMKDRGYIVTTADYVAPGDQETIDASIAASCSVGATPFVSDIFLTMLPEAPQACAP